MTAVVLDTETTGGKEAPEAIEIAYMTLSDPVELRVIDQFERRYRPSKPIQLGALATHHILDEELLEEEPSGSFRLPRGTEFMIGHNVDYDYAVIGSPIGVRLIDTVALSRKFWPEADSHSLGAMMYLLDRANARVRLIASHSALPDCDHCLFVFRRIVERLGNPPTWMEVWEASERARVPEIMPFGKHKGVPMKDVPRDYKDWLLRQSDVDPYLRKALQ